MDTTPINSSCMTSLIMSLPYLSGRAFQPVSGRSWLRFPMGAWNFFPSKIRLSTFVCLLTKLNFPVCSIPKDLPCCVKAMAEFVGKPLTEEVIQRIVHQCSFGEMRKNPASYQVFPGNDDVRFLCKGEVGDWKNHLTLEMNDQIEKEFIEKMREHWLEFD